MALDPSQALFARWQARQDQLQALLQSCGAEDHDWRVDLSCGRFWWQDPDSGRPEVVASTRVLCSYALSNRSLLAGWANRSLPPDAVVPEVPDLLDRVAEADEGDAWGYALTIADASKAHFVYRAPNPQTWVFLGLWDVRPAAPGDEAFAPAPPWDYVRDVLRQLLVDAESRDQATLVRNYARTFLESLVHKGKPWEARLRSVGERLEALAQRPLGEQLEGIKELLVEVSDL